MDATDKKITDKRLRENRYAAQITARIPDALKARLEALADQELVTLGIRQSAMESARQWWQSMDNSQRITWQKRVAPLKGREMIAEAWKQSQGI